MKRALILATAAGLTTAALTYAGLALGLPTAEALIGAGLSAGGLVAAAEVAREARGLDGVRDGPGQREPP